MREVPDFTEFFLSRKGWVQTHMDRVEYRRSKWTVKQTFYGDYIDYAAYKNGVLQHAGTNLAYVADRVEDMADNAETGETGL